MDYMDMMTHLDRTLAQVMVALEWLLGLMMLGLLDQHQRGLQAILEVGSLRICPVIVFNKRWRLLLTARLEQDLMVLVIGPHKVSTILQHAPAMIPNAVQLR